LQALRFCHAQQAAIKHMQSALSLVRYDMRVQQ
jgi:hypothetical protein